MKKIQAIDCHPQLTIKDETEFQNLLKQKDNTRRDSIVKTYQFFAGNDNRWNNSVYASDKFYDYYHKVRDVMAPVIEALKLDEKIITMQGDLDSRTTKVNENRAKSTQLREKRKVERLALQIAANQQIYDTESNDPVFEILKTMDPVKFKSKVMTHGMAREMLRKEPKNSWNDYTNISEKYLNMVLRPCILKTEQNAAENLQAKLQKTHFQENLVEKYRTIVHDVIYSDSKHQVEKNRRKYAGLGAPGRFVTRRRDEVKSPASQHINMNKSFGEFTLEPKKIQTLPDKDQPNIEYAPHFNDAYNPSAQNAIKSKRVSRSMDYRKNDENTSKPSENFFSKQTESRKTADDKKLLTKLMNGRSPFSVDDCGNTLEETKNISRGEGPGKVGNKREKGASVKQRFIKTDTFKNTNLIEEEPKFGETDSWKSSAVNGRGKNINKYNQTWYPSNTGNANKGSLEPCIENYVGNGSMPSSNARSKIAGKNSKVKTIPSIGEVENKIRQSKKSNQ
jgi:hypothetical protein